MMRYSKLSIPPKSLQLLFIATLLTIFSAINFGQTPEAEHEIVLPEKTMRRVVKEILTRSFKPQSKPTVVFLREQDVKQAWLPKIKNTRFQLLPEKEINEKKLKVYYFTRLNRSKDTYDFGFLFGDLCNSRGSHWRFRISKMQLRLWIDSGMGSGCGIGTGVGRAS